MSKRGSNFEPTRGRFSQLLNKSIENTDQDDFLPVSTQKRHSEINTKRKFTQSFPPPPTTTTTKTINSVEKKRTKKSINLFQDVIPVTGIPPWLNLPTEILQQIFSYIPIRSLITQVNRVCRQWYSVIQDETFLYWPKIHLKYEYEETKTLKFIQQTLPHPDYIFEKILQHVSSNSNNLRTIQFQFSLSTCLQLDQQLRKHRLYVYAKHLLENNRFHQEFQLNNSSTKFLNPLCLTTAICILANDVESIRQLIKIWSNIEQIKYEILLDFFYFLLTLFTAATRLYQLQFRYPYRLYYCLKEFQDQTLIQFHSIAQHILNKDSSFTIYSSILAKLLLTPEQEMIVCHNLENRQTMKINAYAGTGKTTTLIAYAAKRLDESFLYIAYNKSIQTHAEKIFPPNVKCQTIHSLAYAKIGRQYEGYLGNLRLKSIVDLIHDRAPVGEKGRSINQLYLRARFVYNAINNFIASADAQITDEHVENSTTSETESQLVLTQQEKNNLAADARFIWSIMKTIRDSRVLMTHDGYLKLYQLSKPQIQLYDCLFIDEAQDLTPAVTDIVNNQRISKILVGDKHQQIYAFRGAINAMAKIDSTVTYYLTKSFRFGFDVAFLSNLILQKFCNEKKYLVGNTKPSYLDGRSASTETSSSEQKAYVFRTNFHLFNCAIELIINKGLKKVGFIGGREAMGFDKILDIFYLWLDPAERRQKNYQIRDTHLQAFTSFQTFEKFSHDVADAELLGKIKLVQLHRHSIVDKIKQLHEKCCSDITQAEIVLSTAHKAKGLEFPIVILSDDFLPRADDCPLEQLPIDRYRESFNILYVAATRATKELVLNVDLFYLLYKMCREPYYDLSFSSTIEQCGSCDETKTLNDILFKIKPIHLSCNSTTTTTGEYSRFPLCVKHLPDSFQSLTQLYSNIEQSIMVD